MYPYISSMKRTPYKMIIQKIMECNPNAVDKLCELHTRRASCPLYIRFSTCDVSASDMIDALVEFDDIDSASL